MVVSELIVNYGSWILNMTKLEYDSSSEYSLKEFVWHIVYGLILKRELEPDLLVLLDGSSNGIS